MAHFSRPVLHLFPFTLIATLSVGGLSLPTFAAVEPRCGDGIVQSAIGEECDDGGTCIGSANAGAHCTADSSCPGGTCTPFGGDGCAANCTLEHDVPYTFGPCPGGGIPETPPSSCTATAIAGDFLLIPWPIGGGCDGGANANLPCVTDGDCPGAACIQARQLWTVGKERDGKIPVVVKASSVHFPGIPVSTLACGCIHGVTAKTCGGTLFEADGKTLSTDCTPVFNSKCTTPLCNTAGEPCNGKPPCAFVHGAGNTASGTIDCAGLTQTDILYEQDSGGSSGVEGPALVTTTTHSGPAGSAVVAQTLGITAALGQCTGSDPSVYGPDGVFCTADDPPGGIISGVGTLPMVTGAATAVVHNANGSDGSDLGPVTASGAPFSCAALECGDQSSAAGGGLAGAFVSVHLQTVGDNAIVQRLFAAGTPPSSCPSLLPACVGDCNGDGAVTIDEIITMVNIALGNLPLSACPNNAETCVGGEVCINSIVEAVNNALFGCPRLGHTCAGIAGLPCGPDEACDIHNPSCAIVDAGGTCIASGGICPAIADPVCGCDGITYANDCERINAGAMLDHTGSCSFPMPTATPVP
jgi:hypothetical protein